MNPTMIRMLQDLTGLDPVKDIPLDSKEVMSLFQNTSALKITPEDIGGCKLGALGIPEFGTDFAMQMLIDAQPKYFSDLVRIPVCLIHYRRMAGQRQTFQSRKAEPPFRPPFVRVMIL